MVSNFVHTRMTGCYSYLMLQRLWLIKWGSTPRFSEKISRKTSKNSTLLYYFIQALSEVSKQAQSPLFFFISFKRCQNSQNKHKFHSFILLHSSVVRKGFICCLHVRPLLVAEVDRTHLAYNHPSKRFR